MTWVLIIVMVLTVISTGGSWASLHMPCSVQMAPCGSRFSCKLCRLICVNEAERYLSKELGKPRKWVNGEKNGYGDEQELGETQEL